MGFVEDKEAPSPVDHPEPAALADQAATMAREGLTTGALEPEEGTEGDTEGR